MVKRTLCIAGLLLAAFLAASQPQTKGASRIAKQKRSRSRLHLFAT
jgi:hypothetical protein